MSALKETSVTKRRILLAEDNPNDVVLLKEAFMAEKLDVEIDCVTDGDQLLKLLTALGEGTQNPYALVILDVRLPRRSAEEVLLLLAEQELRLGVPLIVLTTLISEQERARLMRLGVTEVLSKPFDLKEYFALARKIGAFLAA